MYKMSKKSIDQSRSMMASWFWRFIRVIGLVVIGLPVVLALLMSTLIDAWQHKHEPLAHALCDAIPVGMPAEVAKARAREMTKSIPEIDIKNLSIELVFLNPYSPGGKIVCEAHIWDEKIYNNTVWEMD